MSTTEGQKCDEQQSQVSKTSQISETAEGTTSITSEDQATTFSATFMVVGACRTFQKDNYSCSMSSK